MPPTRPDTPPNVLILGGTTTVARALAPYLLDPKDPKAAFVRLADRFSISPPSTYIDKPFLSLLPESIGADSKLEYKQVNLGNVEKHAELFKLPKEWNGRELYGDEVEKGFDVVFDLTGDTSFDKPELIQISHTYQVSLSLSNSAAALSPALKPKAYVRLTFPFYEMKNLPSSSPGHKEDADLKPDGVRGVWWHEVLRGLGRLAKKEANGELGGLKVGVVRCGAWYGRGTWDGEVVPRVVAGHVYQYLKEEMKFLYNSDLRINTVHSSDIAQALYLLALYLLQTPYATILPSSPSIPFAFAPPSSGNSIFSSNSKRSSLSETWKTVSTIVPKEESVRLPLFNVVDEVDSTQGSLAKVVAETWGIKFGFLSSTVATLVQQFAKTDFSEMVEDVNEMHVQAWSDMLSKSNPPIPSCPITPYLDEHAFRKRSICLDGSLAKTTLGFKPAYPAVDVGEIKKIVKEFQDDNLWPKLE
ncbi:hypothetical protein B9479_003430 [Cryptococcus floricola]|uniref:NAD-dependent epimerase/dehydratase domain-containing protein n=1 Tax=Cryptococcus floricola TaxID=2591691 RepID=A0A5D3AWX5_9TREE|nr:hypothetical protein B9479_003430 [Cryptococcus floricola]